MKFSDFNLNPELLQGLTEAGYIECTPVQQSSIQAALIDHRDVYAQSQTGTGKTAAFLVPVLQLLTQNSNEDEYALVLTPTRELALQVEREAKLLAKYLSLKIVPVLGGMEYGNQEKALRARPRLVIGTPGRLQDFVKQGVLNLKKSKYLIVDEADRMFDMGFQNDVLNIIRAMPARTERVSLLFSATLSAKIGNLVWEHMNNPVDILIKADQVAVDAVDQSVYHVGRNEKLQLLFALIRHHNPRNIIIFSNTKVGASQIAKFFGQLGMTCGVLEGNMPQNKRTRVINSLVSGKLSYLAATDVAARGIHVPNLDWVINFDLPNEAENYVHRIGRTARAGCTGRAISFACERYVYNLSSIESLLGRGKKIPVLRPTEEIQFLMTEVEKELREARKKHAHVESLHEGHHHKREGSPNGAPHHPAAGGAPRRRRPGSDGPPRFERSGPPPHVGTGAMPSYRGSRPEGTGAPREGRNFEAGRPTSGSREGGSGYRGSRPDGGNPNSGSRPPRNYPSSGGGRDGERRPRDARSGGFRSDRGKSDSGGRETRWSNENSGPRPERKERSPEERAAFYKEKYGEDFKRPRENASSRPARERSEGRGPRENSGPHSPRENSGPRSHSGSPRFQGSGPRPPHSSASKRKKGKNKSGLIGQFISLFKEKD